MTAMNEWEVTEGELQVTIAKYAQRKLMKWWGGTCDDPTHTSSWTRFDCSECWDEVRSGLGLD